MVEDVGSVLFARVSQCLQDCVAEPNGLARRAITIACKNGHFQVFSVSKVCAAQISVLEFGARKIGALEIAPATDMPLKTRTRKDRVVEKSNVLNLFPLLPSRPVGSELVGPLLAPNGLVVGHLRSVKNRIGQRHTAEVCCVQCGGIEKRTAKARRAFEVSTNQVEVNDVYARTAGRVCGPAHKSQPQRHQIFLLSDRRRPNL